jgi:hypothetical protein
MGSLRSPPSPKALSQEEILEHEFSFTTYKRRVANAAG